MHDKNIKRLVKKQLKQRFPEWHKLTRRKKKELAKRVLEEVVRTYSFDEDIKAPMNELLGTPDIQSADIMSLSDMACFIDNHNKRILRLPVPSKGQYIKDPELTTIEPLAKVIK